MRRASTIILLLLVAIYFSAPPVQCTTGGSLEEVAGTIERLLVGTITQGMPIRDRLLQIESILFATEVTGSLTDRFDRIRKFLVTNDEYGPSVIYKINAVEWEVFRAIKKGPLTVRVEELEKSIYGKSEKGGLLKRVESLVTDVMPGGQITRAKTVIPAGTLIKVRLLSQVDSATAKVGQEIAFEVVLPVLIEGKMVVSTGGEGFGLIEEVTPPGRFGVNGKISVGSQVVRGVDGTLIPIKITEKAASFNEPQAITLGLTALGLTTLGPVGILTGAIVKGKNVVLPVGSEFYVEVASDQEVGGIVVDVAQGGQ